MTRTGHRPRSSNVAGVLWFYRENSRCGNRRLVTKTVGPVELFPCRNRDNRGLQLWRTSPGGNPPDNREFRIIRPPRVVDDILRSLLTFSRREYKENPPRDDLLVTIHVPPPCLVSYYWPTSSSVERMGKVRKNTMPFRLCNRGAILVED